jgi:hypothetical protein
MFTLEPSNNRLNGINVPIEATMELGMHPITGVYNETALRELDNDPFIKYVRATFSDRVCGIPENRIATLQQSIHNPSQFAQMNSG